MTEKTAIPTAWVPDGALVVGVWEIELEPDDDPADYENDLDFEIVIKVGGRGKVIFHNELNDGQAWEEWAEMDLPERVYVIAEGLTGEEDPLDLNALGEAFINLEYKPDETPRELPRAANSGVE